MMTRRSSSLTSCRPTSRHSQTSRCSWAFTRSCRSGRRSLRACARALRRRWRSWTRRAAKACPATWHCSQTLTCWSLLRASTARARLRAPASRFARQRRCARRPPPRPASPRTTRCTAAASTTGAYGDEGRIAHQHCQHAARRWVGRVGGAQGQRHGWHAHAACVAQQGVERARQRRCNVVPGRRLFVARRAIRRAALRRWRLAARQWRPRQRFAPGWRQRLAARRRCPRRRCLAPRHARQRALRPRQRGKHPRRQRRWRHRGVGARARAGVAAGAQRRFAAWRQRARQRGCGAAARLDHSAAAGLGRGGAPRGATASCHVGASRAAARRRRRCREPRRQQWRLRGQPTRHRRHGCDQPARHWVCAHRREAHHQHDRGGGG
mmetsp:Transcript_45393/g.135434  ORF Transcript_45393/g.135434 Transcript_45393/m.135434 type:complete len:381 (+) Transcript_45393:1217-2359(+)